jgi:hypothetical protein
MYNGEMIPKKHCVLYERRNVPEWQLILGLLEENQIEYALQNTETQDLFGAGSLGLTYSAVTGPPTILVREEDYEQAKDLVTQALTPGNDAADEETALNEEAEKALVRNDPVSKRILFGLVMMVLWLGGIGNLISAYVFVRSFREARFLAVTALIANAVILYFTVKFFIGLIMG